MRIPNLVAVLATMSFLGCDTFAPAVETGAISVVVSVLGSESLTAPLVFSIDNGPRQVIVTGQPVTIPNVPAGSHAVELHLPGVNCSVVASRRNATVTAGRTARVAFGVACTHTGAVRVVTTTSGRYLGAPQYDLLLNGTSSAKLGVSDSGLVSIAPGSHVLQLSDLPPNCTVPDGAMRSIGIVLGEFTQLTFHVQCVERPGAIVVDVQTIGEWQDDGYQLLVVAYDGFRMTVNTPSIGRVTIAELPIAFYEIMLHDLADNCAIVQFPIRVVPVAGDTTTVNVVIDCEADGRVAYETGGSICLVQVNGVSRGCLGSGLASEQTPSWSPDRQWIAFTNQRESGSQIYIARLDRSEERRLTQTGSNYDPAWSPDGRRIAFASTRDSTSSIYVMNADGTNQARLTALPSSQPAWSPDGNRIAFASDRDIYTMNADGTAPTRLTTAGGGGAGSSRAQWPAWSPDGSRIAYEVQICIGPECRYEVHVLDLLQLRLQRLEHARHPTWSPSGRRLVWQIEWCGRDYTFYYYTSPYNCHNSGLAVATADLTGVVGLPAIGRPSRPAWR